MPRLYRPSIPLEVRCRVALGQLGEMWPDAIIAWARENRRFGSLLESLLDRLAVLLGCTVADLRLDHDPPLAARQHRKVRKMTRRGFPTTITVYSPPANDPEHLRYRPHGPQFAGSHLIKTNVRGDGAQYPDRVLIKRERRRQKPPPRSPRAAYLKKLADAKERRRKEAARIRRKVRWRSRPFERRPTNG